MQFGTQIKIVSLLIPTAVVGCLVLCGVLAIDSTQSKLHYEILQNESEHILNLLNSEFEVLKQAGVDGLPHYIASSQKEFLGEVSTGKVKFDADLLILDSSGEVLVSTLDNIEKPGQILELPAGGKLNYLSINDEGYFYYLDSFAPWQWRVYLIVGEDAMHRDRNEFIKFVVLIATILLTVGLLLSYKLTNSIQCSIQSIAAFVQRVEAGDDTATFSDYSKTEELNAVQKGLQQMAETIIERNAKLNDYRGNLEDLVKAQTAELHQKVDETQKALTARKQAEKALEKRMVALTRPIDDAASISMEELFDMKSIQKLQDQFADATGVASIITNTDGTPITKPSNFCKLCMNVIRKTKKGLCNCYKSDAEIGKFNPDGPTVQPCLSGGLWDAGAGISVGGKHIANWLIGQVRDETQTDEKMREYARDIGADEETLINAFHEVPSMQRERFDKVADVLYTLTQQLSDSAYQNIQQARFISERKQSEIQLSEARNYLSNVIDSMPSAIVGVDVSGVVTQWNSMAEQQYDISSESAIGQPLDQSVPYHERVKEQVLKAIESKCTQVIQRLSREVNGTVIYEDVTIYPLMSESMVNGAVVRIDDITDRVRLEGLMVQNEKMSSIAGLAAGMAHEINNPLAAIMQGYQNTLNRISPEKQSNLDVAAEYSLDLVEMNKYLEKRKIFSFIKGGRAAVERAAQIVRNMLMFSRESQSEVVLTDIVSLVEKTIELGSTDYDMKKKYDFKFVDIVKEFDSHIPHIPCCPVEIEQVLLNLFKNALQAMEGIDEENYTPKFHLHLIKETDFVRIEIEDNGPGIPDNIKNRIFEPFFTTKAVGTGTGLGLSVSYTIVTQNHGGTFDVESEVGRGTKFIIRLPITRLSYH